MSVSDEFYAINKVTTQAFREALAQAIGNTGNISKIIKIALGNGGDVDSQGNPAPPSDTGDLNNVILTKDIQTVLHPDTGSVEFQVELEAGELTGNINELALIDENGVTCAKTRLANDMGVNNDVGLVLAWTITF